MSANNNDPLNPDSIDLESDVTISGITQPARDNPTTDGETGDFAGRPDPDDSTLHAANLTTPNSDTLDFSFTPQNFDSATTGFEFSKPVAVKKLKRIGDYEIDRVLGRGGMGIVYKARQTKLGRDVALKMILAGSHASNELLTRFIAEAKAVAHLQHPNIVQIFEVGEHESLPFFSLEFVDGPSLDRRIAGNPLSPEEAARLTATLCEAMQYAHDNGILHRDLKPANVLMSLQGVPKVTDFGLAKRLEDTEDASSTRTGTIMGTPSYMSPEQARGAVHELGPSTDQYSLGAILYDLLAGRPPFLSPKPVETILQVLNNEPVPPRQFQPKLPVDLETICLKALQKNPVNRYSSCTEMAADLNRFLRKEPILARPVSKLEQTWRWCRRNPLVASLSLASIVALLVIAILSTWSATVLASKNEELISSQREIERQSTIAKSNEARALEQEAIALSRAKSIVDTVQNIYTSVNSIDIDENPRMEGSRNAMVGALLPMLEREVLTEMPTDDRALLVRFGLQKSMADTYFRNNRKEEAAKLYEELEKAFSERAERKRTDAARANYAGALRSMSELKRELFRDMDSSLDYCRRQLAVAEDIWKNSRADDKGLGKYSEFQKVQVLTRAHYDLAIILYRIGSLPDAMRHCEIALNGYKKLLQLHATDPNVTKLAPTDQRLLLDGLERTNSTAELAYSNILYRSGSIDAAEAIMHRTVEQSQSNYESDIFNATALRDYAGRLGLLGEFLAQTGRTNESVPMLEEADRLAIKLLTFAPKNSEFQRTFALAKYRLCQWRTALELPDALTPGIEALQIRQERVKAEPKNDRYRTELIWSEAQVGDTAKAIELINSFLALDKVDNELLIELARSFSLIASRADGAEQRSEYLNQATSLIQRALDQGFRDFGILSREIDLKPLWNHEPYKALLKKNER